MFSPKSIEHDGEQGVINRRYPLCSPPANGIQLGDLLTQCPYSLRFSAVCCLNRRNSGVWGSTCRKIILVFTDGACLNNGKDYATAGMGIAIGRGGEDVDQWAIPIDDSIDPRAPRTNQRAELLAAMKGLEKICEVDQGWLAVQHDDRLRRIGRVEEPCNPVCVIVVTDSEYVVKNMNENLPTWKQAGLRTPQGKQKSPINMDLFLKLDEAVTALEAKHHIDIGFWHVNREYNHIADKLSKQGARAASAPEPQRALQLVAVY